LRHGDICTESESPDRDRLLRGAVRSASDIADKASVPQSGAGAGFGLTPLSPWSIGLYTSRKGISRKGAKRQSFAKNTIRMFSRKHRFSKFLKSKCEVLRARILLANFPSLRLCERGFLTCVDTNASGERGAGGEGDVL